AASSRAGESSSPAGRTPHSLLPRPRLPMNLQPLSQLTVPPTEWLWPGYLPLGSLVLLDGDPGLGKSMVTLDLTARLTTGRPFPGQLDSQPPAPVLLVCAEDPPAVILDR